MSWSVLPDDIRYLSARQSAAQAARRAVTQAPLSLGAAFAGHTWGWAPRSVVTAVSRPADEVRRPSPDERARSTVVRIPDDLLRRMADAARRAGRGEHEVWAEAARQWLHLRALDDDPQPPTPAAAGRPRARRSWADVDALLDDLRLVGRRPAPAHRAGEPHTPRGFRGSSAA